MKRFFVLAVAVVLTAGLNPSAWSQGGQAGAGGAAGIGGAGGAGGAGAGAVGAGGTAGPTGAAATGTTGSAAPQSTIGAATGTGRANAAGNTNANRAGANAQVGMNSNFAFGQNPWFANPAARQQLNLNNQQFNQLNQAYRNSWNQYQQNLRSMGTAGVQGRVGVQNPTVAQGGIAGQQQLAARRQQQAEALRNRNANANNGVNTASGVSTPGGVSTAGGVSTSDGTQVAPSGDGVADQRAAQLQRFQNQFMSDFDRSVNSTLTDPQQRQRFNQLSNQFQGVSALNNPAIQRQMKLDTAQQNQLRRLAGEWRREVGEMRQAGNTNPQLMQEQFNQLQNQYNTQLNSILNAEQRQIWLQMQGDQFSFPPHTYYGDGATPQLSPGGSLIGTPEGPAQSTTR